MSSAVKMRAVALRLLGATVVAGFAVASGGVSSDAAPTSTISVLVPVVADAGDGQFLTAEELESETSASGDWRQLTDLASRHGFTVALDSRIPASIAALGTDAPSGALEWLDSVTATNPLLLPWGNADVWTFGPVSTYSFSAEQFARLSGSETGSLVAWPSGQVATDEVTAVSATRGFARVIVGDDLFPGGYDSAASGALSDAVSPDSSTSTVAASAAVLSELDASTTLVLPANPDELDVSRAISVLDEVVDSTFRVTRVVPVTVSASQSPAKLSAAPELLTLAVDAIHADANRAAALTDDPDALIASRVRAFAVLSRDVNSFDFDSRAREFVDDTNWLSRFVGISLATEYTVLSNTAEVPVSVSNESAATVTIDVRVRSTSGIVQVETAAQTVTIAPQSNVRIMVAMTAVANGRTTLVAKLVDPAGEPIGKPVSFPIEVQAQWEFVTIVLFAGGVSIIMTIGIIRTLRRRREVA